jgi:hypothetical protein
MREIFCSNLLMQNTTTEVKKLTNKKLKEKFIDSINRKWKSNWSYTLEARRKHPLNNRLKGLGVSQVEAADIVGVTYGMLNKYLNGYDKMPPETEMKLEAICDFWDKKR